MLRNRLHRCGGIVGVSLMMLVSGCATFKLPVHPSIDGQVLRSGAPVVGATIRVLLEDDDGPQELIDACERGGVRVKTDKEGRFRVATKYKRATISIFSAMDVDNFDDPFDKLEQDVTICGLIDNAPLRLAVLDSWGEAADPAGMTLYMTCHVEKAEDERCELKQESLIPLWNEE